MKYTSFTDLIRNMKKQSIDLSESLRVSKANQNKDTIATSIDYLE